MVCSSEMQKSVTSFCVYFQAAEMYLKECLPCAIPCEALTRGTDCIQQYCISHHCFVSICVFTTLH